MAISKGILGLNARNYIYIRKHNFPSAKKRADDKLVTKQMLIKNNIPTTQLIYEFNGRQDIKKYNWELPKDGFVIKPARGYGGAGILIFNTWSGEEGVTVSGETYTKSQLESHVFDIFEGAYSLQFLPDRAFIEELVTPHPFFRKYTNIGLPDIRVIMFNKVPVMAMVRVPTKESQGKANVHLGALAIGIDLTTGITTHAICKDKPLVFFPDSKIKTRGIRLPYWNEILHIAAKTQIASKLGFVGVDVVFDAFKGPMVLEINARPGLRIQMANRASLRSRLERVENLNIATIERGIDVAQSLFAEDFVEKMKTQGNVLSVIEPITIYSKSGKKRVQAKIDSGAYRTSFDKKIINELAIPLLGKEIFVSSASGQQYRPAVEVEFSLLGKRIQTIATIADRTHLKYPVIIGRRDLSGFLIDPEGEPEKEDIINAEKKM